ncbi:hypothetical protein SH668x_001653 [Planctomicrobium sp. SH668]|uniref:hypothetical protein n=1 Tax=Planctomicrobium sp. SH668 TaxID=3448126 RepID=UPI003F5C822A
MSTSLSPTQCGKTFVAAILVSLLGLIAGCGMDLPAIPEQITQESRWSEQSDTPELLRGDRKDATANSTTLSPRGGTPTQVVFAEAPALPTVAASNIQELRGRVGQEIILTGEVTRVGKSSSGHRFIDFKGNREFSIFVSSDDVKKNWTNDPETLYQGKSVSVQGTLNRHQDKLQIQVRAPDEIELLEMPRGPPMLVAGSPEPVELKSTGKNKWVSPAGVRYEGLDPDGNTRKEHVLRHAEDDPDRPGPHGVFDGGEDLTFAWVDLAWKKVQSDKISPDTESGRDAYTVPMGRRVGFLGGETGKRRKNPPLTTIFIVVRRGTSEIITAFPK